MTRLRGVLALAAVVGGSLVMDVDVGSASSYLDASFGGDGTVQMESPTVNLPIEVEIVDTARMADGRIVVAGEINGDTCSTREWWVGRFTADGQPDPTFGDGLGAVHFAPPGLNPCSSSSLGQSQLVAVAVQSTGKIILGGGPNFALRRLDVQGAVDPTFIAPTFQLPPNLPSSCLIDRARTGGHVYDIVIDPLDGIVAVGSVARRLASVSGCSQGRYTQGAAAILVPPDGVGDEGYSEFPAPWGNGTTERFAFRVALLSDGSPVAVAGTTLHFLGSVQASVPDVYEPISSPTNDVVGLAVDSLDRVTVASLADDYYTLALRRFVAGSPDASFGDVGEVHEQALGRVAGIALDSADRLVAVGNPDHPVRGLRVARFDTAGALDETFGDGGVRDDLPVREVVPSAPDAVNVFVGADDEPTVLARTGRDVFVFGDYLVDGTPDVTVDGDGFRWTPNPTTSPQEQQVALTDLEVAASGETFAIVGHDIVKWRNDGSLDQAFGSGGTLVRPAGANFYELGLDHSGHLVAIAGDPGGSFIARYDASTGAIDPTFAAGGYYVRSGHSLAGLAVDASDRVIFGDADAGVWRPVLVRLLLDGTPDLTFGVSGRTPTGVTAGLIAVDPSDRILVAGSTQFGAPFYVERYAANGSPDSTFARTNVPALPEQLLVDPTGRPLVTMWQGPSAAIRVLSGGGLDTTFGVGGAIPLQPDQGQPRATLDGSGRLVLAAPVVGSKDVVISRFDDGGSPDSTFASVGRARLRLPVAAELGVQQFARIVPSVDAAGRIVVGAVAGRPPLYYIDEVFTLMRLPADPPGDPTAPAIAISVPADGATYLSTDNLVADYDCLDDGSGVDACTGDLADGAILPAALGPRAFTVTATDLARNTSTRTVHFSVLDAASATVAAGATLATGSSASPSDPLDTAVTTPDAGLVSIVERPVTASPVGYQLLGWDAVVTAPAATPSSPLTLTFWLDASALDGLTATSTQVFRDGALVPECTTPADGTATPDPCVAERFVLADGDARITVRTSAASTWTFGRVLDATPPTVQLSQPADGAAFTLGQVVPVSYSCADGDGSGVSACVGSLPDGNNLDTSTAGTFTFTVTATDNAGNESQARSTYEVRAGSVTSTVTGPAVIATDPGGLGPSPQIPIQTRLAVPAGASGTFTIDSRQAGPAPTGFVLLGTAVHTSGPAAPSTSAPHVATFDIDATLLGALPPNRIDVFRDGVVVPACTGTDATPDPCVASRTAAESGDVAVAVRTTQLGGWSFGRKAFIAFSATPDSRGQGATQQVITVTGDGFAPAATARISGTGVSVSSITPVSATSLQLTVNIGGSAPVGARDVIVTNPGPIVATCNSCFRVNPKPAVTSLSPASGPAGATHAAVVVHGSNIQNGASASFSGTGITVHSTTVVSPARLELDVTIDPGAMIGARAVIVTNPDGGIVTKSGAYTVNAPPVVATVTPSRLRRGQTLNVAIGGSGYPATFVANGGSVSFGEGITVQSVVRNSASKLTATVTVDGAAAPGTRSVSVLNPDGGFAQCAGCAEVVVDPTITAIAPSSLARGATAQLVTITGTGFQAGAIAKVSGAGVTVLTTTVIDANTMTVVVTVGGSTALGTRDVTITNPDTGTTTCAACFRVNARPTITSLTPNTGARGTIDQTTTLTGTGFQPGMSVTISGTGVTATVVAVAPTTATLAVTIAAEASTGLRSVTVANPDTGAATKGSAYRVT